MKKLKARVKFFIVLVLITSFACRCTLFGNVVNLTTSDGTPFRCLGVFDTSDTSVKKVRCELRCDPGTPASVTNHFYVLDGGTQLEDLTLEQLEQQVCIGEIRNSTSGPFIDLAPAPQASSSSSASNEVQPTEPPTEAPTEEETGPTFSGPVLSGKFGTYCDPNHAINFRIADGTDTAQVKDELANGSLNLVIADTNVTSTCQVSVDQKILACRYPQNITNFPAQVILYHNSTILTQFAFFGEVCTSTSGGGESSGPTACEIDPTSFACYCEPDPSIDADCPQP